MDFIQTDSDPIEEKATASVNSEEDKMTIESVVEPMVIGGQQREVYHKMIDRVKEYHSKLDLPQLNVKGKVDFFVCCLCFEIFSKKEQLRLHFIKVCQFVICNCLINKLDQSLIIQKKN